MCPVRSATTNASVERGCPPLGSFAQPTAGWVRFERYELRDGVIRPAGGARSEPYDPWGAYRSARGGWGGRAGRAPYESLLELVWTVRPRPGRPGQAARPDHAGERAVLAWCAAHGLLGLLPHEADVAYLAPRWAAAPTPVGRPAVVARGYGDDYPGWQELTEAWRPPETPSSARNGELVPPALWPALWGPPGVHGHVLGGGAWTRRPLGAAWGPYFPDVQAEEKDTYASRPLSPAFWAAYGEPIELFLSAAVLLSDTLRRLGVARHGDRAPGGEARAGEVDPGETPARTIVREVLEETGLRVEATGIVAVLGGPDYRFAYANGDLCEYVSTVFACRVVGGDLHPADGGSLELGYFPPDELPPLHLPYPPAIFRCPPAERALFW